jgi:hypothetical protein
LESVKRDRGGVRQRKYHNTMYKIKNPLDNDSVPQYVVAEYATPLMTYHEACNYSSSDESKSLCHIYVSNFFLVCAILILWCT